MKSESPALEIRGWRPQIGLGIPQAAVQFELSNLEPPMQDFPISNSLNLQIPHPGFQVLHIPTHDLLDELHRHARACDICPFQCL